MMGDRQSVIDARNLTKQFRVKTGRLERASRIDAVVGVSLAVSAGSTLGVVGESGCGKSTLARMLAGLMSPTEGTVAINGVSIGDLTRRQLREMRRNLQFVFQDPSEALNPRFSVADIIKEPWSYHPEFFDAGHSSTERIVELLQLVGLDSRHLTLRAAQLSGGEKQRVGIARALALQPEILILDEPVSALDVSVQAQVLNLLAQLREELGLTLVLVSHDLSVVRYMADEVAVMYLGRIVEYGPFEAVWQAPSHPYTRMLVASTPGQRRFAPERDQVPRVSSELPSPLEPPPGCSYSPRCWMAAEICREEEPSLATKHGAVKVACHFAETARLWEPA